MIASALADVLAAYAGAVSAVDPAALVARAAKHAGLPRRPTVLALGKAAPRMVWGLVDAGFEPRGFVATVEGTPMPRIEGVQWHEGEHPMPRSQSFAAGNALLQWLAKLPAKEPVLVLLSGGSSSCIEVPGKGHTEAEVRAGHQGALAANQSIEAINAQRSAASGLKAGRLRARLGNRPLTTWVLQDTGDPDAVGSGPMGPMQAADRVLATVDDAVAAAGQALAARGFQCYSYPERMGGETHAAVAAFLAGAQLLEGERVALVGGGETHHALPTEPPIGGRACHAAMMGASKLREGEAFAVLATDGIDGTSRDAGAWVEHDDYDAESVSNYTTHAHLAARERTVRTGPSGTNVNDIWMYLRR